MTKGRSDVANMLDISTHTPARGVTAKAVGDRLDSLISTHTPARGVTALGYNVVASL